MAGTADPTGRSRIPFARYNGQAEKALLAAGFPQVYVLRSALHLPGGAPEGVEFQLRLLREIYPVFRLLFPDQVIRADDLARAMVNAVVGIAVQRDRTDQHQSHDH